MGPPRGGRVRSPDWPPTLCCGRSSWRGWRRSGGGGSFWRGISPWGGRARRVRRVLLSLIMPFKPCTSSSGNERRGRFVCEFPRRGIRSREDSGSKATEALGVGNVVFPSILVAWAFAADNVDEDAGTFEDDEASDTGIESAPTKSGGHPYATASVAGYLLGSLATELVGSFSLL